MGQSTKPLLEGLGSMPENMLEVGDVVLGFLVGVATVIFTVVSNRTAQRQFEVGIIISCMERYQVIMDDLCKEKSPCNPTTSRRYLDLCNEELLYIQNNYVRRAIQLEWIEGMLYFLPLLDEKGQELHCPDKLDIESDLIEKVYCRIHHTFRICATDFDLHCEDHRLDATQQILKQVQRYNHDRLHSPHRH